jgi:hypothetical protein
MAALPNTNAAIRQRTHPGEPAKDKRFFIASSCIVFTLTSLETSFGWSQHQSNYFLSFASALPEWSEFDVWLFVNRLAQEETLVLENWEGIKIENHLIFTPDRLFL